MTTRDEVIEKMADYLKPSNEVERTRARSMMRGALAAIEQAGWVCVPREPTEAMTEAGERPFAEPFTGGRLTDPCAVWTAMLDAAPKS